MQIAETVVRREEDDEMWSQEQQNDARKCTMSIRRRVSICRLLFGLLDLVFIMSYQNVQNDPDAGSRYMDFRGRGGEARKGLVTSRLSVAPPCISPENARGT